MALETASKFSYDSSLLFVARVQVAEIIHASKRMLRVVQQRFTRKPDTSSNLLIGMSRSSKVNNHALHFSNFYAAAFDHYYVY